LKRINKRNIKRKSLALVLIQM